jgi:hypothetical protein
LGDAEKFHPWNFSAWAILAQTGNSEFFSVSLVLMRALVPFPPVPYHPVRANGPEQP